VIIKKKIWNISIKKINIKCNVKLYNKDTSVVKFKISIFGWANVLDIIVKINIYCENKYIG